VGNNLNLYIDESGDLGPYDATLSNCFILTIITTIKPNLVNREQTVLNNNLCHLDHSGMLHTSPLIRGTGLYKKVSKGTRHKILEQFLLFSDHAQIRAHSIIIDRSAYPTTTSLISKLTNEINTFLRGNDTLFSPYSHITFYYDNGQPRITHMLDKIICHSNKFTLEQDFDRTESRIFQAADLYTYIDKLCYKLTNNIPLTPSEDCFFSSSDLNFIQSFAKRNRL